MTEGPISTVADAAAALQNANNAPESGPPVPPPTATNIPTPPPANGPSAPANQGQGGHPAWQEILSQVPEMLHPQIRPALENWDRGVQERFQQVHSQYAPYKQFLDANIQPEALQQSYQLWQMLNSDPRALYEQLGNFLGANSSGQGQQQVPNQQQQVPGEVDLGAFGNEEFDLTKHPQYQALMQQQQALAQQQQMLMQGIQMQHQEQLNRQAEAQVASQQQAVMQDLNTKFGMNLTMDPQDRNSRPVWDYILKTAAVIAERTGNYDNAIPQAAQQYVEFVQSVRQMPTANSTAPMVLPPSNGVPSTQGPDTAKMDDQARRAYGVQLLQSMNRES